MGTPSSRWVLTPGRHSHSFFVDRNYRRKGVAAVALQGALELIAQAGSGVVEAYPHDTQGKKTSASFLYNGTRNLFEKAGFSYERTKGTKNCVIGGRSHPARHGATALRHTLIGRSGSSRGCVATVLPAPGQRSTHHPRLLLGQAVVERLTQSGHTPAVSTNFSGPATTWS
jgi:hypothetical protein